MSDFRGVFTWAHKTLGIYEGFLLLEPPQKKAS